MCVCPHFISICADAPSASLIGGEATLLHWAYMDQLTLPLQQHRKIHKEIRPNSRFIKGIVHPKM